MAPVSPPAADGGAGDVSASRLERLVHAEANRARRQAGRRALGERSDLARVAGRHSRDMAARDYFGHVSPDGRTPQERARDAGIRCQVAQGAGSYRVGVAENLFQTWVALRTTVVREGSVTRRIPHNRSAEEIAREVIRGWLDSPGHRRTLLDARAQNHGIGVAVRPDGAVYVAQLVC